MSVITAMEPELGTELEIVPTQLLHAMDGVYFIVTPISCSNLIMRHSSRFQS